MEWAYTVAGLVVGFIVGVTGMGGGALMTPLLILLFNISPAMAIGTDLLFAAITKAGGCMGAWPPRPRRVEDRRPAGGG